MKAKSKLLTVLLLTAATPMAVFAQEVPGGLDAAAGEFSSTFVAAAAVIGGAMISAAFGAIVWKWIKGMIFS